MVFNINKRTSIVISKEIAKKVKELAVLEKRSVSREAEHLLQQAIIQRESLMGDDEKE